MGFRVSCIQMDIAEKQVDNNLSTAIDAILRVGKSGADLVVLPEFFVTPFDYDYVDRIAVKPGSTIEQRLRDAAEKAGIYLIAGSIPERGQNGVFNTSFFFSNKGEIIGTYRKTHLFPLMDEDTHLISGNEMPVFDSPLGKIGIMICYDIRFPELARTMAINGAEILIVPAQFPYPRLDHWRVLLQARAVENQCFVVAVNRVGTFRETRFCGHSSVYDPWGELLSGSGDEPTVVSADIDPTAVQRIRERLPSLSARRDGLYAC